MGMTIDEAISWLNTDDFQSKGFADATSVAIATMRKYQKIKNIICKWEDGLYDDEGVSHVEVLDMISNEVNGDGKNN